MVLGKENFTVAITEKTEGEQTVQVANLTADKEAVKAGYIAVLPEGITIEDVKNISKVTKQFLTDAVDSSTKVAEDLMVENKDISKSFINITGHGVAGSSIDVVVGRQKHYPDMTGKGGEGVTKSTLAVAVKDPGYMLTGNAKRGIVDRLSAALVEK